MILAGLCATALTAAPLSPADARSFRSDVDFVVHSVQTMHPAPFARADKVAFFKDAAFIKSSAPPRGLGCATAELMALVADLHDGHSYIAPINAPNQQQWYPIRFYAFPEGLYVTSVAPEDAELVGKRVLKIGTLNTTTAISKVLAIQGANNPLGAREGAVWLSQAAIAQALGAADAKGMQVSVANADGTTATRTLTALEADINSGWYQQGEMFGPRLHNDAQPYVTAFGGRGPLDFRKADSVLPLHLRYRLPYYLAEMPDAKAIYMQWNFVQDSAAESFAQFVQRLFRTLDSHPDWKLIVDVRYNSGGDGSKVPQIIKQIVKRERFDKPGNLFVLIGRKTFSAAVDFVGEAKEWTSAIFVGEPTGAGVNAYGDPQDLVTPNLKIPLQISTAYHQHAPSQDQSGEFAPDIPAIMTAADYFAGRDPALETILAGEDLLPLPVLGEQFGAAAVKSAYAARSAKWSGIAWWIPFTEHDMNEAAYMVLRGGKPADAVVLFRMNTERYANSWNTWDSLGEAQRAAGDIEGSKASYRQALARYPGDQGATAAIADMEKSGR